MWLSRSDFEELRKCHDCCEEQRKADENLVRLLAEDAVRKKDRAQFARDWEQACADAYDAGGYEPTMTLPEGLYADIRYAVSPITGRSVQVTRVPVFSWPKVRAERGMVVDD